MGKITIEVKINTFGKMKHPNVDGLFVLPLFLVIWYGILVGLNFLPDFGLA